MNFKDLTVRLHVLYVHNTHVNFFFKLDVIYYLIHKLIFLCIYHKNLKFKYLIDNITIDL